MGAAARIGIIGTGWVGSSVAISTLHSGVARDNAALMRELGARFSGYRGIVVMVTNPVDVLTCVFQRASGLPPERVLGTGTLLDTAASAPARSRPASGRAAWRCAARET